MAEVSIRELRNKGGEVVDRVARGGRLTVTRDGVPVAELSPARRADPDSTSLLERWARLLSMDQRRFREDVDSMVDQSL